MMLFLIIGAFAGILLGLRFKVFILIPFILMLACAIGMWRLWYGAVLGFMALMAILSVLFTLFFGALLGSTRRNRCASRKTLVPLEEKLSSAHTPLNATLPPASVRRSHTPLPKGSSG